MTNILVFGSCRLNFNLNKYNLNRPKNIKFIHNHNEILNLIDNLKESKYDILSSYSKLNKLDEDTKNSLFKQIESSDIILLEICSKRTFYEYENNKYKIVSRIYEYLNTYENNLENCNFIKFGNTSQRRYTQIENNFIRRDNIKLFDKEIFNNIKIGDYLNNKDFININYNKKNKNTIIKVINMPNNYFKTFSISFDIDYINERLFTVKLDINCDSNEDIFIKYYNGTEYIYTNQTVNDNIILKNFKYRYLIGFYKKSDKGEIKTSDMLKETNEFYWNIDFNIESYEIILNEFDEIDNTLPKKFYIYKESETEFINNFNDFLNYFKNKKIVVISNLAIKDNNEEIIPKYVNESRLKYMNFLKNTLSKMSNCYFFENYVTNDMLKDVNHYNESGYKIVGEKLEKFLDEL